MSEFKKVILNTKDTANILGISARVFSGWPVEPVSKKSNEVFYDLKQVIAFWKNREKAKEKPLTEERTRLTRIQADKAEHELSLFKNDLHSAKIIKQVWSDQILRFRLISTFSPKGMIPMGLTKKKVCNFLTEKVIALSTEV